MALIETLLALKTFSFLEKFGLGSKKSVDLLLQNVTQEELERLLDNLASQNQWTNKKVELLDQAKIFTYQVGQWGLKVSGSQIATITSRSVSQGLNLTIQSKSTMGQLYDWGKNKQNIETIKNYLESSLVSEEGKKQALQSDPQIDSKIPSKKRINPKFYLILIIVVGIIPIIMRIPILTRIIKKDQQYNYDKQRYCDLAKIQYALENYFQERLIYPNSVENVYLIYFPDAQGLPQDPETDEPYHYQRRSDTRYQLTAELSNGKTEVKDPLIDFPGKNALIIDGPNLSTEQLNNLIGPSLYGYPCSLVE